MQSHSPTQDATYGMYSESDVFAMLHQLVLRVDTESRTQELVEKAQGLNVEDSQLLIDCLSMALDRNIVQSKSRVHVWRSLIRVASSKRLFAQNHVIDSEHLAGSGDDTNPKFFSILGESPSRVWVLRRANNDTQQLYSEEVISWAHLSHPNILSMYATFIATDEHPSLVSPYTTDVKICEYARARPGVLPMPLIFDVVNGLAYIHQLDIVHGGLHPQNVLVSNTGRALITTSYDNSSEAGGSDSAPVRYSAPELLEDDYAQRTKATDIWSLACLCYEILSGNVPFCQFAKEFRVAAAVAKGNKPTRPGEEGTSGNLINDTIWQLLLLCWEYQPEDRPVCLNVQQIFLGMGIQDDRFAAEPVVKPEAIKGSTIDLVRARARLAQVLGSEHPSSLRVPQHLRDTLDKLVPDPIKFKGTTSAINKLSPDDTQHFIDFLDLLLEDDPNLSNDTALTLLCSIMMSTYMVPRCYNLIGVQYDPVPIAEGSFWKAYRGRGQNIRINSVGDPNAVGRFLKSLPAAAHSSHPNLAPFLGVFHEGANDSPRLCLVTQPWIGNLHDYALTLPQKSRLPLISDVINGLNHKHKLQFNYSAAVLRGESVMISGDGRAVLIDSALSSIFVEAGPAASIRKLRFSAPNAGPYVVDDIWSFGCLCYEILSRQLPYYQYTEDAEIRSAASQGELPRRPHCTNDDMDEIDDQMWELITKCCVPGYWERPKAAEVLELIESMHIEDPRPEQGNRFSSDISMMRSPRPNIDFHRIESTLRQIQVELLRNPLSKLVKSRIKDVAAAAVNLADADIRTLVDFLDLALKDHLSISGEQNRVLALLSRITSSTHVFPQCYELKGIKYCSSPIAEGGYGAVHRGIDLNVCVKVMTKVDSKTLTPWIRELILWAHSSHPNILPFHGLLLESNSQSIPRISLVSPFMKNGNLHDYAPRLPQKSRLPLISDVGNGLYYLHGLGIIHSDLKGENVLISNEGRGLITDFGTTQITTATTATTSPPVPSTLRFAAPEVVLNSGQPTPERDVWAFGCLCYEVLSRKLPYYQYAQNIQVSAALARKEPPKRPGAQGRKDSEKDDLDRDEDEGEDEDEDEDWDMIDDQAWNLITKCCTPEPEDRLNISGIQELIKDMKIWDDRPAGKVNLGTELLGLRSASEVDLNRVGELLDVIQEAVVPNAERRDLMDFTDLYNSL